MHMLLQELSPDASAVSFDSLHPPAAADVLCVLDHARPVPRDAVRFNGVASSDRTLLHAHSARLVAPTPQDELAIFVRAFGSHKIPDELPLGRCEMLALTPDGFFVRAAHFPNDPVQVAFSRECMCAGDFQKQILRISEQSMEIMKQSMVAA